MSHPGAFAQQRCGGVGSTCFFELVTANCDIEFSRLKDLTTHDMRVIEEMASTFSGDVSVAERACAMRCVLGHLSQKELGFIIENIDAYQCDHQVLRSDLFPLARAGPVMLPRDIAAEILVLPLGCARTVCVGAGCGAKLPLLSVHADTDPLKGDGSAKKRMYSDRVTKGALVISENFSGGETHAKLFYKRCDNCKLLHYHDHAERRGVIEGSLVAARL